MRRIALILFAYVGLIAAGVSVYQPQNRPALAADVPTYQPQATRQTTAVRTARIPRIGELIFDTNTQLLYIGDGATTGGVVANWLTTTGNGGNLTNINPANIASGTAGISITGNAATVTNGLVSTGSYASPSWLTSISPTIISSGTAGISITGNAATATNGVVTTGSYASPAWLTQINGSIVTGTVPTATALTHLTAVASASSGAYNITAGTGNYDSPDGGILLGGSTAHPHTCPGLNTTLPAFLGGYDDHNMWGSQASQFGQDHNVIGSGSGGHSGVHGTFNSVFGPYARVSGGTLNFALSSYSTVAGGRQNIAGGVTNYNLGRSFADGGTTSGSATVTSGSVANFQANDVGKTITGTGIPSSTTITAVNSATSITISQNATATSGRTFADGVTTSGSPTVTSAAGANFQAGDVGKAIAGTGIPNGATISTVNSTTSITISANATATGSSLVLTIGTPVTLTIRGDVVAARSFADATLSNGSPTLTSTATAQFQPGDIGQTVTGTNIPPNTTIIAWTSATQVTLSANATGTASGTYVINSQSLQFATVPTLSAGQLLVIDNGALGEIAAVGSTNVNYVTLLSNLVLPHTQGCQVISTNGTGTALTGAVTAGATTLNLASTVTVSTGQPIYLDTGVVSGVNVSEQVTVASGTTGTSITLQSPGCRYAHAATSLVITTLDTTASDATVGGGQTNKAIALQATVGGGFNNYAKAQAATVAGGSGNQGVGQFSFVGGGTGNAASGNGSSVLGGGDGGGNTANALNSSVLGGTGNTMTGANSGGGGSSTTISSAGINGFAWGASNSLTAANGALFGSSNSVSGAGGFISGGTNNTVSAANGVASGVFAKSYIASQRSFSNGRFLNAGDSQASEVILQLVTTSTTSTEMSLDGGAVNFPTMPDNTTWGFQYMVVARTTGHVTVAEFDGKGTISRGTGNGSVALFGGAVVNANAANAAGSALSITADTINGCPSFAVTAPNSNTTHWVGYLRLVEVGG